MHLRQGKQGKQVKRSEVGSGPRHTDLVAIGNGGWCAMTRALARAHGGVLVLVRTPAWCRSDIK